MLSAELLKQIKRIQLKAGHLASSSMVGEYSSAFRGLGMEFDEVREYVPGDDVRRIDWNVTAKMNTPFIKTYREEREMTLILLVDVSPSQNFGSVGKFKKEIAAELAAVLAFLAIKNNDKVGLIAFSDHIEQYIPPKKGRAHVWRIIKEILTHQGAGKKTDISEALDYMMKIQKQKAMCFLISDFIAEDFQKSIRIAAKRHELICAHITDPREKSLPDCGYIELEDRESQQRIIIDSSDKQVRQQYADRVGRWYQKLQKDMQRCGADFFAVDTTEVVTTPLMLYMKKREGKR